MIPLAYISTMTPYEVFIGGHFLGFSDILPEDGECPFDRVSYATAYITAIAIERMNPLMFPRNPKHKVAVEDMVNTFNRYRKQVGRDEEYREAAKVVGLCTKVSTSIRKDDALYVANLGLTVSVNSKDKRFVHKALCTYFKKAFPEYKRLVAEFNRTTTLEWHEAWPEPSIAEIQKDILSMKPSFQGWGTTNFMSMVEIMEKHRKRRNGALDTPTMQMLNCIMGMFDSMNVLLLGLDSDFDYINTQDVPLGWSILDGNDLPKGLQGGRDAPILKHIDPSIDACSTCMEEFSSILTELRFVHAAEIAKIDEGEDFEGMISGEDESFDDPLNHGVYKRVAEFTTPIFRNLFQTLNEMSDLLSERHVCITEANTKITELEAELMNRDQVASSGQEMELLKEEIEAANRKLRKAQAESARLQAELMRVTNENFRLANNLSEANNRYNDLNEQMIDLIESDGVFLKNDPIDEVTKEIGIRERIGEEAYQKLKGMRVMIVGGHPNTCAALHELFPDWEFRTDVAAVRSASWAVDAIACIVSYASHKVFYAARDLAKSKGTQFVTVPCSGSASICQYLITHVVKNPANKTTDTV